MQPTNHAPAGSPGPAGSSYESYKQKADEGIQAILDSGKQAVDSGKKWLEDSDLAGKAKELPQKAKDLGSKALDGFNSLTLTQKVVSVGTLAAGVAFLITHSSRKKSQAHHDYSPASRRKDDFLGHQPHTRKGNEPLGRGQRPWGTSRFGAGAPGPGNKPRVQAGSGYGGNRRRDQGPAF